MKIKHLTIENFRGVKKFDFDLEGNINVLTGINGSGKSTILHAIDILMSWMVARLRNISGSGIKLTDYDITTGEDYCFMRIMLADGTSWSLYKQHSKIRTKSLLKSELRELTEWTSKVVSSITPENQVCPLFTSYGVKRAVESTPQRIRKNGDFDLLDVYNVKNDVDFHSFFIWFRMKEDIENEIYRHGGSGSDLQIETVRKALREIFPDFGPLYVRRRNPVGFYIVKADQELKFNDLSDGEKAYIMLVADIARKLSMTHPLSSNPLEEEAVVLIDEIDLHLHPTWQREVLVKLQTIFPHCQFFISTHSPFVISAVNAQNHDVLFELKNGEAAVCQQNVYGQDVSSILLEILGMLSLRTPAVEEKIQTIWRLLAENKVSSNEYEKTLDWLKEHLDINDDMFTQINVQERILKTVQR